MVLTHDVEGHLGFSQCRRLMDLELDRGFRSSFGFIPESNCGVSAEFRANLVERGFELAVHDIYHDAKLYSSERSFAKKTSCISRYIDEWQVAGFRSGLMHRNLEWLNKLKIVYDSSTFDCDPFEPQSDGAETIFPFWVDRGDGTGFVELPITMIQDFNLFVILQEAGIDIWKKKLDWIAERGGMALLNTHPDYMSFGKGKFRRHQYPASYYAEFLDYAKMHYGGVYWHAKPLEVAQYFRSLQRSLPVNRPDAPFIIPARRANPKKIWIDLDNTPHVPFFKPIIEALKKRGYSVLITARDAFQVIELADEKKMEFIAVGHHYGKNIVAKFWGLIYRGMQLIPTIVPYAPDLALSHGARSQVFLCNLLNIKSVILADYEYAKIVPMARPSWLIVPEAMSNFPTGIPEANIRKYPGIKENVYVPFFKPDASLSKALGLKEQDIVVTVRPPATEAHYRNPASEVLFNSLMEYLVHTEKVRVILLPRNINQQIELIQKRPDWFSAEKIVIPSKAVDGLNLIWNSDLVVSGGGTMNREAAALNVPVYSIFKGPTGAIDKYLQANDKLTMIENIEDIQNKIRLVKRQRNINSPDVSNETLESILNHIEEILTL